MTTGFDVLVLLHVLCVVGGFGAVAYNGLYLSLAAQRPGGTAAVLEVNRLVTGLAEILIYAALLFGIGAVAASRSGIKFSDPWVAAALGIYFVEVGILHGWIRPNQRRHYEVVVRIESAGAGEGDVALVKRGERRVALGWGAFNLLVVAAVYLMVFRPGG